MSVAVLTLPALPALPSVPTRAPDADPLTAARLRTILTEVHALRPGGYVETSAADLAGRVIHLEAQLAAREPWARLGLAAWQAAQRGSTLAPASVLAAMSAPTTPDAPGTAS